MVGCLGFNHNIIQMENYLIFLIVIHQLNKIHIYRVLKMDCQSYKEDYYNNMFYKLFSVLLIQLLINTIQQVVKYQWLLTIIYIGQQHILLNPMHLYINHINFQMLKLIIADQYHRSNTNRQPKLEFYQAIYQYCKRTFYIFGKEQQLQQNLGNN